MGLDHESELKYFDKNGWSQVQIRALHCFFDFEDGKVQNPRNLAESLFPLVRFLLFYGTTKLYQKEKFMKTLSRYLHETKATEALFRRTVPVL
jgi:hypothetical protein